MCCHSCFSTEFAANYVFLPECAVNHVFSQNVLEIMFSPKKAANRVFFPECAANYVFPQNVLPIMFSFRR
jgi:hypothetical protein